MWLKKKINLRSQRRETSPSIPGVIEDQLIDLPQRIGQDMARYALTPIQRGILEHWMEEENGYLDSAIDTSGVSARNSGMPVLEFIRSRSTNEQRADNDTAWVGCGMIQWILDNDNRNVNRQQIPPEAPVWIGILRKWDASITFGFSFASKEERDRQLKGIRGQGMIGGGEFGTQQQLLISNVLRVLE
jgi:hypothetical protein